MLTTGQKVTMGFCALVWATNVVASAYVFKKMEEKDKEYAAANKKFDAATAAGRYLISILEREGVALTDFDKLALEVFSTDEAAETPIGEG